MYVDILLSYDWYNLKLECGKYELSFIFIIFVSCLGLIILFKTKNIFGQDHCGDISKSSIQNQFCE